MVSLRQVIVYSAEGGREPFTEWLDRLKDRTGAMRIRTRIDRVEEGHFGDYKSVGEGVFELRFHFGPGYRVYFGLHGEVLVILLCGGDKDSQEKDIAQARAFWQDWLANADKEGDP